MQKYQLDQNPSRKMLDEIAREVRLKKRVVQVWFQNTRARERKGIIKMNPAPPTSASLISSSSSSTPSVQLSSKPLSSSTQICKRCPFCISANHAANVFLSRADLESHLITKHNYTYEQISSFDIELFPDVSAEDKSSKQPSALAKPIIANKNQLNPPSLSPNPATTSPASTMQNLYSNFLLQQQQQQQQQQFQNALLQQQGANNGINSMLMSTLLAHFQQQQQQQQSNKLMQNEDMPLDLTSALGLGSLGASFGKSKPESIEKQLKPSADSRSRSSSSSGVSNGAKQVSISKPQSSALNSAVQKQQQQQQQQHQRRVRTQMTQYQVNVMRLIFAEYKTPTMNECEQLGREINLKKRVVQVWFQNARAKEKKSQPNGGNSGINRSILFSNTANNDLSNYEFSPDECLLCNVKYNGASSVPGANSQQQRDHLFSKGHLNKLIQFVTNIAVENGANPGEINSGKLFTGFTTDSQSKKRNFFNNDDDDNSENNNAVDYDEDVEYDEDLADDDNENYDEENQENDKDEPNEEDNSEHESAKLASFDINRLLSQQAANSLGKSNQSDYLAAYSMQQQQQQQNQQQNFYNYLLYSNLLSNNNGSASPAGLKAPLPALPGINLNNLTPSSSSSTSSTSSASSTSSSSSTTTSPFYNQQLNGNPSAVTAAALAQIYAVAANSSTPSLASIQNLLQQQSSSVQSSNKRKEDRMNDIATISPPLSGSGIQTPTSLTAEFNNKRFKY